MSTRLDESLIDACGKGDLHKVHEILEKDSDIINKLNQRIGLLYTPLHKSARWAHADILKLLLNHGASVNAVDKGGDTPLHKAARWGHDGILQLLLNHGAEVNAVNKEGYTPLHYAIFQVPDILQLLLNHGANVNTVNNYDDTPLHEAARGGRYYILQLLLNYGANVNAVNNGGYAPLHKAACEGHVKCIEVCFSREIVNVQQLS
jgi:ankyrin repeat protein